MTIWYVLVRRTIEYHQAKVINLCHFLHIFVIFNGLKTSGSLRMHEKNTRRLINRKLSFHKLILKGLVGNTHKMHFVKISIEWCCLIFLCNISEKIMWLRIFYHYWISVNTKKCSFYQAVPCENTKHRARYDLQPWHNMCIYYIFLILDLPLRSSPTLSVLMWD